MQIVVIAEGWYHFWAVNDSETLYGRERTRMAGEVGEQLLLGEEDSRVTLLRGATELEAEETAIDLIFDNIRGHVALEEESQSETYTLRYVVGSV